MLYFTDILACDGAGDIEYTFDWLLGTGRGYTELCSRFAGWINLWEKCTTTDKYNGCFYV